MNETSNGRKRIITILLIFAAIFGIWHFMRQPDTTAAIDGAVDAFVPGPARMDRNLSNVQNARAVADLINSRQTFPREGSE